MALFTNRNFVYLTGIEIENFVLMAEKWQDEVHEILFISPSDEYLERWNGRRIKPAEVTEICGVEDVRMIDGFAPYLHCQLNQGKFRTAALDLFRCAKTDEDTGPFCWGRRIRKDQPAVRMIDSNRQLRIQCTYKPPCEIEAMRQAGDWLPFRG